MKTYTVVCGSRAYGPFEDRSAAEMTAANLATHPEAQWCSITIRTDGRTNEPEEEE